MAEPGPDPGPDPADEYPLRVGSRVRHADWGDGILTGLQKDGAEAFVKSWKDLLARIAEKSESLRKAG